VPGPVPGPLTDLVWSGLLPGPGQAKTCGPLTCSCKLNYMYGSHGVKAVSALISTIPASNPCHQQAAGRGWGGGPSKSWGNGGFECSKDQKYEVRYEQAQGYENTPIPAKCSAVVLSGSRPQSPCLVSEWWLSV
jgi:hypothetical protein